MGNKLQILFPRTHFTFCFKLCLFQSGALSNDGGADQRPLHPADHHPGSPQQHDAQHRQPWGSGLQWDTWRSVTHCDHAMHNFKFWPFLKTKWLKPNVLHCIVTSTQCCDLCTQLVDWAENCCYCCRVQTSRDLSGGHWWPTLSLTSKLMFWLIQPLLSGRGTSIVVVVSHTHLFGKSKLLNRKTMNEHLFNIGDRIEIYLWSGNNVLEKF